ncbi:MAG: nucleotidyltransferase domain-containing protein [Verrucomicrobia bacterium]|nr:nucleotidyltransferase domain-containing protein [Verrucomicrobiota bacterium]
MILPPFNPLLRVPHNDPLQKEAWLEACRIAAWLREEQPGCRVRAFGSLVRPGAWHPRSDIDLAVEGAVESPWKLQANAQRKFFRFRVQIVSSATGKGEPSPERSAFLEEIQRTGVELPADKPTVHREPELPVIAQRLFQAGERMQDELQKILAPAQSDAPSQVRHCAMMLHVTRYRVRLEDALQRVLGFVDRLERLLPDGDDRIMLYQTASEDIAGLRPALITREIADWHCEFVEKEYGLMATEEEEALVQFHRIELPRIHHATLEAFESFQAFLLHGE